MSSLTNLNSEIRKIFAYLSHYPLPFGLTLGPFLHILFGLLWTAFCIRYKRSFRFTFLSLLAIACLKELYDSFTLENRIEKHLFDIAITIMPACLWWAYKFLKAKWRS